MDAVQKANSGHPGAPMGMADIAEVLWRSHLKHNPNNPKYKFFIEAWRRMPISVANRLGPYIVRNLG